MVVVVVQTAVVLLLGVVSNVEHMDEQSLRVAVDVAIHFPIRFLNYHSRCRKQPALLIECQPALALSFGHM